MVRPTSGLRVFAFSVLAVAGIAGAAAQTEPVRDPSEGEGSRGEEGGDRWETDMARFEAEDLASPPREGGTVFVGSSSIRMWDLDETFPGSGFVNRGFGGSEMADAVRYFERIVLPHRPARIVLYAGDNDIANGKSAQEVFQDFRNFVDQVRRHLPGAEVVYLPIKPSIARWSHWPEMRVANALIEGYCASDERLSVVETADAMLETGEPPSEALFVADGLHLSPRGYALWEECLRRLEVFRDIAAPSAEVKEAIVPTERESESDADADADSGADAPP